MRPVLPCPRCGGQKTRQKCGRYRCLICDRARKLLGQRKQQAKKPAQPKPVPVVKLPSHFAVECWRETGKDPLLALDVAMNVYKRVTDS